MNSQFRGPPIPEGSRQDHGATVLSCQARNDALVVGLLFFIATALLKPNREIDCHVKHRSHSLRITIFKDTDRRLCCQHGRIYTALKAPLHSGFNGKGRAVLVSSKVGQV